MSLDATISWLAVRDAWRAKVGRLPRAYEPRLRSYVDRFGSLRALRSINATRGSGLRRAAERWAYFAALYGEAP